MTLNQTWRNCLRMWKWIAKVWKKDGPNVKELKEIWLDGHGFGKKIEEDCFFCEYAEQNAGKDPRKCESCPGVLVDSHFSCGNSTYHFFYKPIKFYKKLLMLDAKRKAGRK